MEKRTMPLRWVMTPFEHYMYADDIPSYPMACFHEFYFDGTFDRLLLLDSLRHAIHAHPLYGSLVKGNPENITADIHWEFQDDHLPFISWESSEVPITYLTQGFIDLRKEVGLRLWLREDNGSTFILMQWHHSVADGRGAFQFAQTLLTSYHQLKTHPNVPLSPIAFDARMFDNRNTFRLNWRFRLTQFRLGLAGTMRFLTGKPVPILNPRGHNFVAREDHFPVPNPVACRFDPAFLTRLSTTAKASGYKINDLLLACLFNGLKDWVARDGNNAKQTLRVAVPIDIRQDHHRSLAAANIVSMAFFDRKLYEINGTPGFLRDLRQEMDQNKEWMLSLTLLNAIRLMGRFKNALKIYFKPGKCQSSTVFSNLGVVFKNTGLPMDQQGQVISGNVKLIDLTMMGPLRELTPLNFMAYSYAGRLKVSLYFDGRLFTKQEADQMLALFTGYIDNLSSRCSFF